LGEGGYSLYKTKKKKDNGGGGKRITPKREKWECESKGGVPTRGKGVSGVKKYG